jgi:hypothetical protein
MPGGYQGTRQDGAGFILDDSQDVCVRRVGGTGKEGLGSKEQTQYQPSSHASLPFLKVSR